LEQQIIFATKNLNLHLKMKANDNFSSQKEKVRWQTILLSQKTKFCQLYVKTDHAMNLLQY